MSNWVINPEDAGQIIVRSHADCESGRIEHIFDQSDRSESYALFPWTKSGNAARRGKKITAAKAHHLLEEQS